MGGGVPDSKSLPLANLLGQSADVHFLCVIASASLQAHTHHTMDRQGHQAMGAAVQYTDAHCIGGSNVHDEEWII